MSQHYDFAIRCVLKPNTPQQVIDTLAYMTRREDFPFDNPPPHPLFEDDGWREILFTASQTETLACDYWSRFWRSRRTWILSFRIQMLDDSFYHDWWRLAGWLARWSETSGFVGFFQEELKPHPTLIYFLDGAVYTSEISQEPILQFKDTNETLERELADAENSAKATTRSASRNRPQR